MYLYEPAVFGVHDTVPLPVEPCPVAAGVIACHLQQNRTTAPKHLKGYLNNKIAADTNVYKGVTPSSTDPNDPLWNQHYGNMGNDIKVIRDTFMKY